MVTLWWDFSFYKYLVIQFSNNSLISKAFTCSAESSCGNSGRHVHLAEAEIDQPDMTVRVEHDVFGFEISVDDVSVVEVLDRADDLTQVELGHVLGHHSFDLHSSEQLAAVTKLLEIEIVPL